MLYFSENTVSSSWEDWEILESLAMGKAVIAIHKGDRPPARLPPAAVDNRVPVVPWNQQAIMEGRVLSGCYGVIRAMIASGLTLSKARKRRVEASAVNLCGAGGFLASYTGL